MRMTASYASPANENMTLTAGNFFQLLYDRPHYLGLVGQLHPEYTLSYITQVLGNVFYTNGEGDRKKNPSVTVIDNLSFSWDIRSNEIKRISFAESAIDTNTGASEGSWTSANEVNFMMSESYYQRGDVFEVDKSHQQFRVISKPEIISSKCVRICAKLIDPTGKQKINFAACSKGMTTRWLYSPAPEVHYEGYSKFTSNIERYKGYVTRHRYEISVSSEYQMKEDYFMKIAKEDGVHHDEKLYALDEYQNILLETTLSGINSANLLAKTNVDANGHATDFDEVTKQPIIIGDGVVPTCQKYACKAVYTDHVTWSGMQRIVHSLNDKRNSYIGNQYLFLCNSKFWQDINELGLKTAYAWKECAEPAIWSKKANGNTGGFTKLGATFSAFEIEGNEIIFKVDSALSMEYPDKGFAMMLDIKPDALKNRPAIECFSFYDGQGKSKEFYSNFLPGVGSKSVPNGGAVASPLAASTYINVAYSGIGVYMPFLSGFIMQA